ncbi:MAG TPA: hypothetical protein VGZ25_00050 [Gemmataceae bacterium]|nr:hypothetical protein [Gemmataceae bacterium]
MCALRRVPDSLAGPRAVGILVPPGSKTVIILRPRTLPWDLLLLANREQQTPCFPFQEFSQPDAKRAASELLQALLKWSEGDVPGRVAAVAALDGSTHQVQAEIGRFNLIVCKRQPGQPYKPNEFTSVEDAQALAEILTAKLQATGSLDQEVYLNTCNFSS